MASLSRECADDTFGPLVRSCARHADFTLLFEQSILAIPCDALFLLLAPWRIAVLWKTRPTTKMGQRGPAKQIIGVAWALLQVLLFVWSRGDGALVTRASIPSATLGLAAALVYLPLSHYEHGRTVRPSTLINVYLAASLLLGLPQARTLFSITSQWHLKATYMSVLITKGLLLLLEAWEKRALLHDQYQSLPVESTSGILNKILFLWINKLFKRGYSRLMDVDDLGTIDKSLHSASLLGNVELAWSKRSQSHTWPLIKTLAWSLRWSILAPVPPRLCYSAFLFAQPFLIKRATSYLEQNPASDQAENLGYGLIGATACIYVGIALSYALYQHQLYRHITMLRGSLVSLIYTESLELEDRLEDATSAVTLMSTDVDRICQSMVFMHDVWARPLELCIGISLLANQLGWIVVVPVLVVVASAVADTRVTALIGGRVKMWTDQVQRRISLTGDVLLSLKSVKMLGLTEPMRALLQKSRLQELVLQRKFRWSTVWLNALGNVPPALAPAITLSAYAIQSSRDGSGSLSASHAFTSLALISLVTTPAEELLTAIPSAATSLGCLGRIQTHLLRSRRQDSRIHHAPWDDKNVISAEAIKLHDLQISTLHNQTLYPHSLNLAIPRGKTTLVKGPSGCGKSTLLKAILGEVRSMGSIMLGEERVAYCSQLPWLFAGSVQENICGLSGQPIDEDWYTNVLDACALTGLRSLSPHTMSGGEKQRLQLARATYHRPGLFLLDDALSALDAKTEAWVCQRLLSKDGLLRKSNATIVFVTHSARYDSMADHVISIDEKHVVAKDLPRPSRSKVFDKPETESLTEGTAPSSPVKESGGSVDADVSIPILAEPNPAQSDPLCNSQTSINKDSREKSQNTDGDFRDYVYYAKSVKPLVMVAFVASAVCQAVCYYMSQVVLRLWTADDSGHQARWLPAYLVLSGGNVCFFGCTCWIMFLQLVPDSAANLHKILLDSVLGAPYSFLAKTEVGVILNRFSQDMTLIDSQLPAGVLCTLVYSLWTVGSLALIATGSTWMALTIPVILGVLFVIQRIYLRTSRRIRILELELRGPTYSHFLDTLKGLPVIRAFGWEHDFTKILVAKLDLSQIPYYTLYIVQRWLILVLDLIVAALAVIAMTMAVKLRSSTSPEALGLSLNNVLTFNQTLALLMQFWTQLEISLGAIRRTREFEATTPCEPKTAVVAGLPSSTWPDHGAIEFRGLSAGYATGQLAVKEVSMAIRPGSKVALCGRSGSGKSTLLLTLLRMLDPQAGSVSIDGRDLQGIPHALLRERLFTIPQDPMLLQHSVRFNLDPQAEYDDSDLSSALSRVMLFSLLENRGGLDAIVMPDTFSHGQRQLFSLARVLLRKAKRKAETDLPQGKVLLLDEATSSIDRETEQVVQAIVAEEFQGFTILVIAHRLDTILDSDSIAVFDQTRLVEFGSPTALLGRPSAFRDLYDEYISQAGL